MSLGKIKKHGGSFVPPKLQITSMMDMFTIILIFLLFSFSDKPDIAGLEKNMELPTSSAKTEHSETMKLILSTTNLKLGDRVVAEVKDGKIIGLNPRNLKESALYQELKTVSVETSSTISDSAEPKPILFFCDKRLPYKTINNITKTAALAGFPNFQFAVLKKR